MRLSRIAIVALLLVSGCGKKEDGKKVQELASKLDECTGDLAKSKSELNACKQAQTDAQALEDTSTVTVKVVGDVLTLEARKTSGTRTTPPEITNADAQQVYAAAIKVIRDNRSAIQVCYDRALKQDNSLANQTIKANLDFTVEPSGKVAKPSISPRIGKTFNDCVEASMNNWRFTGLPGKSMRVSAPITLTSSDK